MVKRNARDGIFRADKFTFPTDKKVECKVRFLDRRKRADINELSCDALGGKRGEKSKTVRDELILEGRDAPFSMVVTINGNTVMDSSKVTYFHFDSTFGIGEVTREVARATKQKRVQIGGLGLAQPAIEGLDHFVMRAHTHISSPKEVARLVEGAKDLAELRKLDISFKTRDLLKDLGKKASCKTVIKKEAKEGKEAETELVCNPVMFLNWRENGSTKTKVVPLAPAPKETHGEIIFSNPLEMYCSMPGAVSKVPLVSTAIRDLLARPACIAPVPPQAMEE